MNVVKLTFDELQLKQRYIFYFSVENVALFACLNDKYFGTLYPSQEKYPNLSLTNLSLLGSYSKKIRKFYKTPLLNCDFYGVDVYDYQTNANVYTFQVSFCKLPPELNQLIQEYL